MIWSGDRDSVTIRKTKRSKCDRFRMAAGRILKAAHFDYLTPPVPRAWADSRPRLSAAAARFSIV